MATLLRRGAARRRKPAKTRRRVCCPITCRKFCRACCAASASSCRRTAIRCARSLWCSSGSRPPSILKRELGDRRADDLPAQCRFHGRREGSIWQLSGCTLRHARMGYGCALTPHARAFGLPVSPYGIPPVASARVTVVTRSGATLTARTFLPAFAGLMACALLAPAQAGVDRPPQFVVMAFDNCTELERWQELTDFAAQMNRDGDRLHFTFFVSGINYHRRCQPQHLRRPAPAPRRLAHQFRRHAAGHRAAASTTSTRSIAPATRSPRTRSAISTAGPGRPPTGTRNSAPTAISYENVGPNNGLADAQLAFAPGDVIGFRAPYLAKSAGPLHGAAEQRLPLRHQRRSAVPTNGRRRSTASGASISPG